jgi:hypothetical protein
MWAEDRHETRTIPQHYNLVILMNIYVMPRTFLLRFGVFLTEERPCYFRLAMVPVLSPFLLGCFLWILKGTDSSIDLKRKTICIEI